MVTHGVSMQPRFHTAGSSRLGAHMVWATSLVVAAVAPELEPEPALETESKEFR